MARYVYFCHKNVIVPDEGSSLSQSPRVSRTQGRAAAMLEGQVAVLRQASVVGSLWDPGSYPGWQWLL